MKKLICLVALIAQYCALFAQTPDTNKGDRVKENAQNINVPDKIRDRFASDNPNMQPMWTLDGSRYRAEYRDEISGNRRAIIYDAQGSALFTEKELKDDEYPAAISTYYSKTFPNESYNVWSSQDTEGTPYYLINRQSEILFFDEEGNYTRSSRRTDYKKSK